MSVHLLQRVTIFYTLRTLTVMSGTDVHGNGNNWVPMDPMGFPREWE